MFIGRTKELNILAEQFALNRSSLVVCKGRRRVGKSTLIREFGSRAERFFEFQGLSPTQGITAQDQRIHFSRQLTEQTGMPQFSLDSWTQSFALLNTQLDTRPTVVLLDEVSWMAHEDPHFAGELKVAWDTKFSQQKHLMLILCGSVTSWIEKNILASTGFVGRVSTTLTLEELPLKDCNRFWPVDSLVSPMEKLKILSVTGGIPKYLEEINPSRAAEDNITRLCFRKEGFLFAEFDRIFSDIFSSRATTYRNIVETLVTGRKRHNEISAALNKVPSGHLGEALSILKESGFIAKDVVYQPASAQRREYFRLKDNYLRFFLKTIAPLAQRIEQDLFHNTPIEQLVQWDSIMGLQFENLVLSNLSAIFDLLRIPPGTVRSASPFVQRATQRKRACQIDLLIETKYTLYVGEIKFRRSPLTPKVVDQVRDKMQRLAAPSQFSVRPFLVYAGSLTTSLTECGFFDRLICFEELLGE